MKSKIIDRYQIGRDAESQIYREVEWKIDKCSDKKTLADTEIKIETNRQKHESESEIDR